MEPIDKSKFPLRVDIARRRMTRCLADDDGMCEPGTDCPQLRDGEPKKTGRHCPLDDDNEEEE